MTSTWVMNIKQLNADNNNKIKRWKGGKGREEDRKIRKIRNYSFEKGGEMIEGEDNSHALNVLATQYSLLSASFFPN